ncbi:arginine decarboxylase, pyruvoyl-dependent [Candidatus Parcubacteria bacterium]|nr:arginine decarboxylase, pyruvoyl-dependent [Candidatus Parcubacteria bacterium]
MVPTKFFLTKGVGIHKNYLQAFELALEKAGISKFNLVSVSSILPPNCKKISKDEGLKYLKAGEIVFVVMSRNATNEPNRLIAASIGCAIPADSNQYGYIAEHHSFGQTQEKAGEFAEDLAASMLASTLGIPFDPDQAWDEREKVFKMSGKIVYTTNITQTAEGNKDGLWTCVVAAAVFVP